MKKRFIYFSLTASLLSLPTTQVQGEVVNLSSGLISEGRASLPTKEIVRGDNFVKVTYTFENTNIHADTESPGVYTIQYDGFGKSSTPGYPSLPMRADKIVIPDGCTAQVELVESEYTDIKMELSPSFVEESYSVITQPDMIISNTFAPEKCVEIQNTGEYRGVRFCNVGVTPFQYNSSTKTLRAYKSLTYQLTFEENQISKVRKSSVNPSISENDPIRNSQNVIWPSTPSSVMLSTDSTFNFDSDFDFFSFEREKQSYLVVTSTALRPAAERFAEHKHKMGFNMYVETKDTWSTSEVQQTIKDYYEQDPNLYYTLFIGDQIIVPSFRKLKKSLSKYDYLSDVDYFCLDGPDDLYPDVYGGRWPTKDLEQSEILVDKTITYEIDSPNDNRYLSSAVLAAHFQDNDSNGYEDRRFILTTEEIARYISDKYNHIRRIYSKPNGCIPTHWNRAEYADGSEIFPELREENFQWHTNIDSIFKSINDGCSLLFFCAHGQTQWWCDPFFSINDFWAIKNKNKYPIFIGTSCFLGRYEKDDNFVRNFISKKEAGCVAAIAATDESFCYSNDAFSQSMINAVWPIPGIYPSIGAQFHSPTSTCSPVYTIGEILQSGLLRIEEILPDDNSFRSDIYKTKNHYLRQIYHCFGDPSLPVYWTQYDRKKVTPKQDAFNRDFIFSTKEKAEFLVNYIGTDTYLKFRTNQIKFQDKNKDKYHIWVRLPGTNYASIWGGAISNGFESASISKCAVSQDSKLKIEIDSPDAISNESYLNMMDKYGRNVKSLKIDHSDANITVDISDIDHGFYIVTLVSDGEVISSKQVIK